MNKPKQTKLVREEQYVEFLAKRLTSQNFKAKVSSEEFAETKRKYDKAKLKLRMLRGEF